MGEHIPARAEGAMLRNLHAHNCRGIILSWASLRQTGQGHINNHRLDYISRQVGSLGYALNSNLTAQLRQGAAAAGMPTYSYLTRNVAAYERLAPIVPCRTHKACTFHRNRRCVRGEAELVGPTCPPTLLR